MKGKRFLAALLAAASVFTASGCAAGAASVRDLTKGAKNAQTQTLYDTSAVQDTAAALTGFGAKLLQNEMQEENPLVSPLSVARRGGRDEDADGADARRGYGEPERLFFRAASVFGK